MYTEAELAYFNAGLKDRAYLGWEILHTNDIQFHLLLPSLTT